MLHNHLFSTLESSAGGVVNYSFMDFSINFWTPMYSVISMLLSLVQSTGSLSILFFSLYSRSVFVNRFEEVLHIIYGEKDYWEVQ